MWRIDKSLVDATDRIRQTAEDFRAGLTDLTSDVREEIRGAGDTVTFALVIIGSVAFLALAVACIAESKASSRG